MKLALSLCGGGSKGAYEAGAIQALYELGYQFDLVTGCSIGAFNGAMVVQNQFTRARELWNKITIQGVITGGINFEPSFEKMAEQRDLILPFLKNAISNGIDISPLKELMEEYIDPDAFFESGVDFGTITVSFPQMKPVFKTKDELNHDNLREWLLASATCFPAFPLCEIDNDHYIDGGFYDKLPIELAFEMGADHVIAIDLNIEPTHEQYQNHPCVTYICPTYDLGPFLSFDQDTIQKNILMGYLDTMKAFGKLKGRHFAFSIPVGSDEEKLAQCFCKQLTMCELFKGDKNDPVLSRLSADYPLTKMLAKYDSSPLGVFIEALEYCMLMLQVDPLVKYSIADAVNIVCNGYPLDIPLPKDNQDLKKKLKSFTEDMIFAQLIKQTVKQ